MPLRPVDDDTRQHSSPSATPTPRLQSGPGAVFVDDTGWDDVPRGDKSLKVYYSLIDRIVDMGYLAYSGGNMYFYLDASRHWTLLMAKDALARICKIVGSDNVSVSTGEAVEHYYPWLAKRAIVNATLPLQRSICIGTRRREVSIDGTAPLKSYANIIMIPRARFKDFEDEVRRLSDRILWNEHVKPLTTAI